MSESPEADYLLQIAQLRIQLEAREEETASLRTQLQQAEARLGAAQDALYWVTSYAPLGYHMAATDEEWHRVLRHARSLASSNADPQEKPEGFHSLAGPSFYCRECGYNLSRGGHHEECSAVLPASSNADPQEGT